MGRVLSIDYGMKRIGLAKTDPMKIIASGVGMIERKKSFELTLEEIHKQVAAKDIDTYLIGLPLHLDGKESDMSQEVRNFAKKLEETTEKKVVLWDERLSSKQVEKVLMESGVKRKDRTKHVDTMSATLLLQSYLASIV